MELGWLVGLQHCRAENRFPWCLLFSSFSLLSSRSVDKTKPSNSLRLVLGCSQSLPTAFQISLLRYLRLSFYLSWYGQNVAAQNDFAPLDPLTTLAWTTLRLISAILFNFLSPIDRSSPQLGMAANAGSEKTECPLPSKVVGYSVLLE